MGFTEYLPMNIYVFLVLQCFICCRLLADSVTLPPATLDYPQIIAVDGVVFGATGNAGSNFISLPSYDAQDQPPSLLQEDKADARWAAGAWLQATEGRWSLTAGRGQREWYRGNQDAGQLWLDLHSDVPLSRSYAPEALVTRLQTDWVGVSYTAPASVGQVEGQLSLQVRLLQPRDLQMGEAIGTVSNNDVYTGMLKIISARSTEGASGWAIDTGANATLAPRLRASVMVEGIAGEINWRKVEVSDTYVVSPGVFTDADGFLHDFWIASGMRWSRQFTLKIDPIVTATLNYQNDPEISVIFRHEQGQNNVTLFITRPGKINTTVGISPQYGNCSVGFTGNDGGVVVSFDEWPGDHPRNLKLNLYMRLLKF